MTALSADILGVAIWGPGLEGWAASAPILAGTQPYAFRASPPPAPAVLAATERRRAGPVVRLALAVAQEATAASALPPESLPSVFASGHGDAVVVGSILEALAAAGQQPRAVSPTQFHNSVHNAAAGYWSIGTGNPHPATCLGLGDDSYAAGLLKALAEVTTTNRPLLLCVYDHPLPPPLDACRPTLAPFAAGLVLAPPGFGAGTALARLHLHWQPETPATLPSPRTPGLAALVAGNACARALPLLEALARHEAELPALPYLEGSLALRLSW